MTLRSPSCVAIALVAVALLLGATLMPARAQAQVPDTVPARSDTLRADTLLADTPPLRVDTLAADSAAQDTVPPPPPPPLPPMHTPVPEGFATGVWVWDRDELLAEPYLSVNDLLDRIPGVMTIRSGFHLQPEAASAWGASGAGIEVVLDGYMMWGLADPTFDLARIELGTLRSVRIERRAAGLRVVLHTVEAFAGEPYTRIEASIGEPIAVNLFRGQFLTPKLGFGPFGAAVERLEVEGIGRREPADMFSGWLKWGLTRERYGAQIEFRQQSLERESESPYAGKFSRRDILMRARWIATDGLTLEAYGGLSGAEITPLDITGGLADDPIERDVVQVGTRAALQRGPLAVEAGFRFNNERRMPTTQLDARSWLQFGPIVGVGGEVRHASWRDGDATTSFLLNGVVTPIPQVSLFAQFGSGSQGAPAWGDDARRIIESKHTMLRGGAHLRWRGVDVGGALLSVERDSLFGFRLPFDNAADPIPGDTHRGWELYGHVPLFRDIIAVDGGITTWFDGISGIYNPTQSWRAALSVHLDPLESGNLDVLTRLEARHRGVLFLPTLVPDDIQLQSVPDRTLLDWWLTIQILSVQAFLRWEDLAGIGAADIPGRPLPGPRILYGVKWYFVN